MTPRLDHVDVFARRKYAGNQLAVVHGDLSMSAETMRRVADEMNYSETAFVTSTTPGDDGWPVCVFTADRELPFAGHPALGTARVVREKIADGRPDALTLSLGGGPVEVRVERRDGDDVYWFDRDESSFGPRVDAATLAPAVGLDADDFDADRPIRVVGTGLDVLVAPVRSLAAVRDAAFDARAYERLADSVDAGSVILFAPEVEDDGNDLHARVFTVRGSREEDPATGSANSCLAAYLLEHGDDDAFELRVEQGCEMDRPSLLFVRGDRRGDAPTWSVGGSVVPVAEGTLMD